MPSDRALLLASIMIGVLVAAACTAPAPRPPLAPTVPPSPARTAEAAPGTPVIRRGRGLDSAWDGVVGTVLITERVEGPCWLGVRALVHIEATIRPSDSDGNLAGHLEWFEARIPRGRSNCVVELPFRAEPQLFRSGVRLAIFSAADHIPQPLDLDLRNGAAVATFAAPFDRLPALAQRFGPKQTMWEWLAPAAAKLERQGDVIVDHATGLVWQRDPAPQAMGEGDAHEFCAGLFVDGRKDWRVPSITEVVTLLSRGGSGVNQKLLPSPEGWFWTWHDGKTAEPWIASFADGQIVDTHYDDPDPYGPYQVRCVAGHLAVARRILISDGFTLKEEHYVDRWTALAWTRQARPAATRAEARKACQGSWRLPSMAELRTRALRRWPDAVVVEDSLLWASDAKRRWHDSDGSFEWAENNFDRPKRALCVRAEPRPNVEASTRYPSGEVFARGDQRWWEDGTLAWDGARSFFPGGQRASELTFTDGALEGAARFFARDGKEVAKLSFHRGLLDGEIVVSDPQQRVRGVARGGALEGLANIGSHDGLTARGQFVAGARDGQWTLSRGDHPVGRTTYRLGSLHGPASSDLEPKVSGAYANGWHDGQWTSLLRGRRGAGHFERGSGDWREWQGRTLVHRQAWRAEIPHGVREKWSPAGVLTLRVVYEQGIERSRESWYESGRLEHQRNATREVSFHGNGRKRSEVALHNGRQHGKYAAWDEHGKLTWWGEYRDDQAVGPWRQRLANGQVLVRVWRGGYPSGRPHLEK